MNIIFPIHPCFVYCLFFRENREKTIIGHQENMISYTEQQSFHYVEDNNGIVSENDNIFILDPSLNVSNDNREQFSTKSKDYWLTSGV